MVTPWFRQMDLLGAAITVDVLYIEISHLGVIYFTAFKGFATRLGPDFWPVSGKIKVVVKCKMWRQSLLVNVSNTVAVIG